MRHTGFFVLAVMTGLPPALAAQAGGSANPISETYRGTASRYAANIVKAFEAMPADKYGFKPTDAQLTFGFVAHHIAQANYALCSAIGGEKGATLPDRDGTEPKDTLIDELKTSFEFCDQAMNKLTDDHLTDEVQMFGRSRPKAAAALGYVIDLVDHYSQLAIYLRLNGILPPTAQRRGGS